jgi:hypothetical protein
VQIEVVEEENVFVPAPADGEAERAVGVSITE